MFPMNILFFVPFGASFFCCGCPLFSYKLVVWQLSCLLKMASVVVPSWMVWGAGRGKNVRGIVQVSPACVADKCP